MNLELKLVESTLAAKAKVGQRTQLTDEAADYIRGLIMSGQLRPGQSVRPEAVAEEIGISTTPVREALQALRVEGFLNSIPRKGFEVAPLDGDDIRDLFVAQSLIAGELAARAALTADVGQLSEIEAIHHEIIAAARRRDLAFLEEKNFEFHRQINLVMAGSRKLAWSLGLLVRYVPRMFYAGIDGWPDATVTDHSIIVDRMLARDPDGARSAMRDHIIHSGELLARHFDSKEISSRTAASPVQDRQP